MLIVLPFNAIRKFRKEFGFLPPVTPEGREALQRLIDDYLGDAARYFLLECETQDNVLGILRNFTNQDRKYIWNEVHDAEERLRYIKILLQEKKECFWKKHAIAKSPYLPQPFKVLEKVGDYKDVTFENPAKHEKDKDIGPGVGGRGLPSREQGG